MTATLSTVADREIGRLLEENRQLSRDLKQCQADKDFVWSLWKKLQVSNPDVTQAVGLVVQREREKAELRDRKVLEILQRKDERIEELQANLAYNSRELGNTMARSNDGNEEIARLQRQVDTLQDRNSTLELQVRNIESREKNLENVHSGTLRDVETEKREMSQKVSSLSMELEKARSEKADEMALRVQLESKVRVLDREVQQKLGKFEQLVNELEEARSLLRRFESQVKQQQQDLDYKNQELETVRAELAELWTTHNQLTEHSSQQADLIRQIQSLQTDTQKMLKNQEEAYSLESTSLQQMYTDLTGRYDAAKKAESDLRSKVLALKKELLDRDDKIADIERRAGRSTAPCQDNSGSFLYDDKVEPVLDLDFKCRSLQKEVENLRRQLSQKQSHIEHLEEDAINQTIEFDVARLNRHERTHSTPSRQFRSVGLSPMRAPGPPETERPVKGQSHRSRSMSPTRREMQAKPRFHIMKDLEDCRAILKLKIRELSELKKAHQKRLERLKSVQENYRNVKEQLKTLEAEHYGSKKKSKKIKRADPKDLRHEDSAAVWNELAYFKNENRNMAVERMGLEEEVDNLRVQASQDAATIHELRLALDQEKDEHQYDLKKKDRDFEGVSTQKSEIVLLKSEVQNKQVTVERLERDLVDSRGDREALSQEKKLLKQEIVELKQAASQGRMEHADLRRDIQRLRRELQEEKAISRLNAKKVATQATTPAPVKTVIVKSSKCRRKHVRPGHNQFNTSKKFEELIEEGWEEVSEDSASEGEEERLDAARSSQAGHMRPSSRERRAAAVHLDRQREPPARHTMARAHHALYRDIATSPGPQSAPVSAQSPQRAHKSPAAYSAVVRQLRPMKQRVGYLQQQVVTLRESRASALKTVEELRESNTQLQTDLNLAQQRLRVSKQSLQKATSDLDKVSQDKKELEQRLVNKMESLPPDTSRSDIKVLESRLKSCSSELSRQNNVVRQLKQENETLNDQVKLLQDKVSRAERDSSQKRTLLEDQRSRVKQALETARADAESLEQLETRTKLLQDTNEKQKIQMDSYKKRLAAVTREKRDYEERFLQVTADLDKKNKLLLDSQMRKGELETSLGDMERLATQQMKCLARESEGALETAKDKMREIHEVLVAYQRFVTNLAQEIVRRLQQTRGEVRREEEVKRAAPDRTGGVSTQRAHDLARDILNISQSDLDDILSADGEHSRLDSELETERRRDKKWTKKVDRLQNSKDDFALALVDLFVQKMEERVDLSAKLNNLRQPAPVQVPLPTQ